jgi:hypothetical protein
MPTAYMIDSDHSLVLCRAWEAVSDGELTSHVRTMTADPRFNKHFHELVDARGMTSVVPSSSAVRQIATVNPFGAGARRALIVGSDVLYGMARMYEMMRDPSADQFAIFKDMDEALEWLGLSAAKAELERALAEAPPLPPPL